MFQDMYYFLCNQRFMKTYSMYEENQLTCQRERYQYCSQCSLNATRWSDINITWHCNLQMAAQYFWICAYQWQQHTNGNISIQGIQTPSQVASIISTIRQICTLVCRRWFSKILSTKYDTLSCDMSRSRIPMVTRKLHNPIILIYFLSWWEYYYFHIIFVIDYHYNVVVGLKWTWIATCIVILY